MPLIAGECHSHFERSWAWCWAVALILSTLLLPAGRGGELWIGRRGFGYDPLKWRTGMIQACGPSGSQVERYFGPFWTIERN